MLVMGRVAWRQVFYRVHIAGFLILVIFANMHYNRVWLWVFPGAP